MEKIILIGGAPTVGKTSAAKKCAEMLKSQWISTDLIREQMRGIVDKRKYPALFSHAAPTKDLALRFLTENTPLEIVEHQNKESEEVWKGVKALIEADYVWDPYSGIIEGVAVLPKLAAQIMKKHSRVKAIFLIEDNVDRIRKVVFTRGIWDDAPKYSDSVKEKEVAWVVAFNDYIKKEAKKYGLPTISVTSNGDYLEQIKKLFS